MACRGVRGPPAEVFLSATMPNPRTGLDKKYIARPYTPVSNAAALGVVEWFVHRHATYPWEGWPGFYAIFGFVAFAGIVLLGKQLRRVIRRDDDYYND